MAGIVLSRSERCAQTKERNARRKRERLEKEAKRVRLSPEAQLAKLDARLGKGQGAKREREKLIEKIESKKTRSAYDGKTDNELAA